MIFSIGWREFKTLFLSPLAWAILAVVQLILGYMFLGHIEQYLIWQSRLLGMEGAPGLTEIVAAPLFGNAAIILLLVVPLITMRLVSEERRNRTLSLLFSAPISMTEIILGKYLGILLFLFIVLLMITLMPLSLLVGGKLDFGLLSSGFIGLGLLLAGFAAVGLFMSTLTQHPTVAAISSFGILLLFWILDISGGQGNNDDNMLASLSLLNHYEPFLRGIFDSTDAIYHLLFITTFLVLSIRRLDADRLGG
ncbi:MAG: ABC transporter permease subunit [Gammaproteobacteria bacterium]|nr:ABC transporter permease subunit [Gammaproteobacteria bacterium]